MSRTYRRRRQRHEYRWVLREWEWCDHVLRWTVVDPRSGKDDARLRVFIPTPNEPCAAARRIDIAECSRFACGPRTPGSCADG